MALLRRMEASIVGCDDQLVHLRSVPCEMLRPIPKYMKVYAQWAWVCIAMHYL